MLKKIILNLRKYFHKDNNIFKYGNYQKLMNIEKEIKRLQKEKDDLIKSDGGFFIYTDTFPLGKDEDFMSELNKIPNLKIIKTEKIL